MQRSGCGQLYEWISYDGDDLDMEDEQFNQFYTVCEHNNIFKSCMNEVTAHTDPSLIFAVDDRTLVAMVTNYSQADNNVRRMSVTASGQF